MDGTVPPSYMELVDRWGPVQIQSLEKASISFGASQIRLLFGTLFTQEDDGLKTAVFKKNRAKPKKCLSPPKNQIRYKKLPKF